MPKLYIAVLSLFLIQAASAQRPELQWVKAFTMPAWGSTYSNGRTVGVDQAGNVYSAGLLHNTIDLDPGPAVFPLTGSGLSGYGIYISKLDAGGNFVWAKEIPSLVEFGDIELKVDKDGNVYLASNLPDPADMDPGPGVQMMTPIGAKDAFVVKLDTDGNLVWAKQFGGPGDTVPEANTLVIDKDGNLVICGMFNNTVDFDPGPGSYNLTSTAHIQSYIVKLSNHGDFIWAKQFGNSPVVYSGSHIVDVQCDAQGSIYMVGGFAGTCDFDPGAAVYSLKANSIRDGFIAKLTANADFVWAKHIANLSTEYNYLVESRAIEIDGMNNVVTTGFFIGTFDFDPGTAVSSITTSGAYDCYILKLTAQGEFVWVKTIGGTLHDSGNDLELDKDNNIYVVGDFGPSVDFDPGPGDYTINTPGYGASAVVKLNAQGNFVYAAAFPSVSYGSSLFRRMTMDPSLNIYVTGFVSGTIDFDPGPNVHPVTGSSNESPFVLKLGPCANRTVSTLNISACNNFTLNNEIFESSGTYTQTISNMAGCDSVITLHLILNKKATQQTKVICEGETFFAGGADQTASGKYVDTLQTVLGCDSVVTTYLTVNPKALPNLGPDKNLCSNTEVSVTPGPFASYLWQDMSNASSFKISAPGKYWVRVTNSFGCSATDTLIIPAILPVPSNFLKASDSICAYESLQLSSTNAYAGYQWSTGATERKVQLQQPGVYWLTVTDANGCSATDTFTLYTKQCRSGFYIPSAFSPNGDRQNDVLRPLLFGQVKQYRFVVYNRWGAMVFQTTDPQKGWDGKMAGNPQPNTIFVWTCFYQLEGMEPKTEKGTVTLIR